MHLAYKIFRTVAPWILLSVTGTLVPPAGLAILWTAVFALRAGWAVYRKRPWALMDWVAFGLYVTLFANGYFRLHRWLGMHGAAVCYAALAVAAAGSTLVGEPFSSAYARRLVPRDKWDHPVFRAINRSVSLAWATSFAANAAICLLLPVSWTVQAVCWTSLACAATIAELYPAMVRARFAVAARRT